MIHFFFVFTGLKIFKFVYGKKFSAPIFFQFLKTIWLVEIKHCPANLIFSSLAKALLIKVKSFYKVLKRFVNCFWIIHYLENGLENIISCFIWFFYETTLVYIFRYIKLPSSPLTKFVTKLYPKWWFRRLYWKVIYWNYSKVLRGLEGIVFTVIKLHLPSHSSNDYKLTAKAPFKKLTPSLPPLFSFCNSLTR